MKQIIVKKEVPTVELEQVLFTRTRTKSSINATAINAVSLMLAANTVDIARINAIRAKIASNVFTEKVTRQDLFAEEKSIRTFTFTQVADFIVNKLRIVNAYHKKDNRKIYDELSTFSPEKILADKSLTKKAVKATALRLRNHTSHHIFQTKVYETYFNMSMTNSDSFTVKDSMLELIQNQTVRAHVAAVTKTVKK